jgi:prevent-host-death family protein
MQAAKIADLKNNLSRYLGLVRKGAEITVLDRTTPVARLVPYAPDRSSADVTDDEAGAASSARIAELTRQGVLSPGDPKAVADWLGTHPPVTRPPRSRTATRVLLDMRAESRR